LLVPLFVYLLVYNYNGWALGVFVVAGLTDALDGAIARMWDQQTTLGRYLDPMADKLLISSAFICLGLLSRIPFWVMLVVVSRDVILTLGTVVLHRVQGRLDISPSLLGKGTTLAQLTLITLVLMMIAGFEVSAYIDGAIWLVVMVTLLSGLHYLYRGVKCLNGEII
jgi:cardiolipin synthase